MKRLHFLPALPLLLALSPLATSQEIEAIPLPSLCEPAAPPPTPAALRDGAHIVLRIDRNRVAAPRAPYLATSLFTRLLEQQAREAETNLRVIPGDRPLLVTGNAAAIETARSTRRSLDEAGKRLEVKLEVRLSPRSLNAPEAWSEEEVQTGDRVWRSTVRSGEEAFFGSRERLPFLSTFDVEVSADAGAADPVTGHVYLGETLHLRARRVRGGSAVYLNGVLDLAELLANEEFDPDNLDLGKLQQPLVASALVQFSDVVEASEVSFLTLRGLPLTVPDWTLQIRATTTPEPAPPESSAGEPEGWALLDLAFLSAESGELPPSAYAEEWEGGAEALPRSFPAWNANALQGLLDSAAPGVLRPQEGRGVPVVAGNRLLLLDRRAQAAWRAAVDLAAAAERTRTKTGRLEVTIGEGRIQFDAPLSTNDPLRLQCGTERTYLTDFTVEIAPETWMPVPEVSTYFEGVHLDAGLTGADTLIVELSQRSIAEEDRVVSSDTTSQGILQWPKRSVRATRLLCPLDAEAQLAFGGPEKGDAHVSVRALRQN